MWLQESFFKYTTAIIFVLLIFLLLYYTSPIFEPILWFIAAILLPILFSTILYYVLRPLVYLIEKWMPRYLAILTVYLVIFLLGLFVSLFLVPEIASSVGKISPEKISALKGNINQIVSRINIYLPFSNVPILEEMFVTYATNINSFIYQLVVNLITTLAGIAVGIALTPFVLYYFLRDDNLLSRFILRFVPTKFHEEVQKILQDIDTTLSEFIVAQMTVAAIIGGFLLIGYSLIGLPNALPLALFAMIFYVIPFLGTFIAVIPAVIVGLTISMWLTLKVILVMFVAHFIEANLVTPKLMSIRLKIHPLTVIILLLAAGSLWGLLGLLLVTPTYAIIKVIVWNIYKISRLHLAAVKAAAHETDLP